MKALVDEGKKISCASTFEPEVKAANLFELYLSVHFSAVQCTLGFFVVEE